MSRKNNTIIICSSRRLVTQNARFEPTDRAKLKPFFTDLLPYRSISHLSTESILDVLDAQLIPSYSNGHDIETDVVHPVRLENVLFSRFHH